MEYVFVCLIVLLLKYSVLSIFSTTDCDTQAHISYLHIQI